MRKQADPNDNARPFGLQGELKRWSQTSFTTAVTVPANLLDSTRPGHTVADAAPENPELSGTSARSLTARVVHELP